MAQKQINSVANNTDKQKTYQAQTKQYNLAMKYGFYFEAMMIVYGLMEDRLCSFLYHSGALANRQATKIGSAKTKTAIKEIVSQHKLEGESDGLGIMSISGKGKLVRCMLTWAATTESCPKEDRYRCVLKNRLEGLDIGGLLETLDEIGVWCDYRNEVIHALMNKNIDSLHEHLEEQVIHGMALARFLDAQVKLLKKGNKVRKAANLPMQ